MSGKSYRDADGNECTLIQLIRREPEWAESTIIRLGRISYAATKWLEMLEENHASDPILEMVRAISVGLAP